jgi:trans-aconitate methyltransferase
MWMHVSLVAFSYWHDPRIHELGNTGIKGALHASLAPLSTAIIDRIAYDGLNVRQAVKDLYFDKKSIDFCCGVGFSTGQVGVDTSIPMVSVAKLLHRDKTFHLGNSEDWGGDSEFDVATCMFGFHEMPSHGRQNVLQNMLRVAPVAIIVDIHPLYTPGHRMLVGEPYLLDYLEDIMDDITAISSENDASIDYMEIVSRRVALWKVEKSKDSIPTQDHHG